MAGWDGTIPDMPMTYDDIDPSMFDADARLRFMDDQGIAAQIQAKPDSLLILPTGATPERTFQLLTQLAGRSGRDAPGKVLVVHVVDDVFTLDPTPLLDITGYISTAEGGGLLGSGALAGLRSASTEEAIAAAVGGTGEVWWPTTGDTVHLIYTANGSP